MPRNMGLGKLKGAMDGKERKSRLDAAIEADSGAPPKKKKPVKKPAPKKK